MTEAELHQGARQGWDARYAHEALNSAEAILLCRAWANGQRSWTNLVQRGGHSGYEEGHSQQRTIAIMDAAETQKWSALAQAYLAAGL
jgi:hypothetical protein